MSRPWGDLSVPPLPSCPDPAACEQVGCADKCSPFADGYEAGRAAGLREAAEWCDQRADLSSDLGDAAYLRAFAATIRARAEEVSRG